MIVNWLDVEEQDSDYYTGFSYWPAQLTSVWDMRINLPGAHPLAPGLVTPVYYLRFNEDITLHTTINVMEILVHEV